MLQTITFGLAQAGASSDDWWTASLADCETFAATFDNTCTGAGSQYQNTALAAVAGVSVSFQGDGVCTSTDAMSGSTCTFTRKLCVSCFSDAGTVKIRVRTNGLPNHAFFAPSTSLVAQNVDYTVNWLPTATMQSANNVESQSDVNSLICNIMRSRDSNIPSSSGFTNNGDTHNTAWGVAQTGVLMFNAVSGEGVDPFYPAAYGSVTDPSAVVEKVDACLAHPQRYGVFHYHSAPICLPNPSAASGYKAGGGGDIKTRTQSAYYSNS